MTGNPYAATRVYDPATRPRPPVPSQAPVARLTALGASEDVLAEVARRWDAATPDEQTAAGQAVDALTDDELVAEIDATDAELFADATRAAETVVGGKVAAVAEWVGLSMMRARAVLAVEQANPKPRASLVEYCERLLAGFDPTL